MGNPEPRVLILSHGHPEEHPGGGEIAAYQEHCELRDRGIDSLFLASSLRPAPHLDSPFSTVGAGGQEVLFHGRCDDFMMTRDDLRYVAQDFGQLLEAFGPTVIHFHHFTNLGLDLVRAARNYSRSVPIVLTLHEHLAMCHNRGHMARTFDGSLCSRSSAPRCHRCFPEIPQGQFLLRELWVRSAFELVDQFITPSEFLRQRFIDWGLPAERVCTIENGQPSVRSAPLRPLSEGQVRGSFAFFGQVAPHKGIQVLLEGFRLVEPHLREKMQLVIFGGNLRFQDDSFQEAVYRFQQERYPNVRWTGRYEVEDIPRLIEEVDWVVVPSIWWENSPLVIQEAFAHGRPVICTGIGGMAEKVVDGVSGLHFRLKDPQDLARVLVRAAFEPGLHETLSTGTRPAPTIAETCDALLDLFEGVKVRGRVGASGLAIQSVQ